MALHAPAIRASTAVFALAACAAFGLAIRDTAGGGAPGIEAAFATGDDLAPRPDSGASGAPGRDGVPSAAELAAADAAEAEEAAEAIAAFAGAAAARAGDPAARDRALRSLLDPRVGPACWLSLSEPSTADRLDVLARLGVRVAAWGRHASQRVVIAPLPGASLGCADLERAAAAVWGAGRPGSHGPAWLAPDGDHRAELRAQGGCELRIEPRRSA